MSPTAVITPAQGGVNWQSRRIDPRLKAPISTTMNLWPKTRSSRMCRVTPISVLMLPEAASVGAWNCKTCPSIALVLLLP